VLLSVLASFLALAAPSPLPFARSQVPVDARLVLRADVDARTSVFGFLAPRPIAFVLHFDATRWRRLPAGKVRVRVLGPDAGATTSQRVLQVAAELSAPSKIVQAGLWVDGHAIPGEPKGSSTRFTVYGPTPRLKSGVHTAAAFAEAGGAALVKLWTFRVR
jgi:hypothetical protein